VPVAVPFFLHIKFRPQVLLHLHREDHLMSTHYQGPASLPSDYALLSRYAGHHPEVPTAPNGDDADISDEEHSDMSRRVDASIRRSSMPGVRHRPLSPAIYTEPQRPRPFSAIPMPHPVVSENTPLLNPPLPRIDEPFDGVSAANRKMAVFWEELRVLTRYSLPVFGFVTSFFCFRSF